MNGIKDGRIDLRDGLRREPSTLSIVLTTPGIVYQDLLIVGRGDPESLPAPPGDIRAYDVRVKFAGRSTRFSVRVKPVMRLGLKDAWQYSGTANNWAGIALDEKRGILGRHI